MKSSYSPAEARNNEALAPLLLSRVNILHERDGGMVEAMVPTELIYREDVPVDQEHVRELAESMRKVAKNSQDDGQLSAVLLGEVPGESNFRIIDGFHRDAVLYEKDANEIFASIRRDVSLEEVLDLRILTANTHASVGFARLVEWVQDAWQKSPWQERVSAAQAFSLVASKSSGAKMGFTPEEATEVKAWAADKCERWRISASVVYDSLATAQVVDPSLIQEARQRIGKKALTAITPQHLRVIGKGLPHRYAEQRLVAKIATSHNFNTQRTHKAAELLSGTADIDEARALVEKTDWSNIQPSRKSDVRRKSSTKGRFEKTQDPKIYRELFVSELEVAKLSLENLVLRGEYIAPPLTGEPMDLIPAIVKFEKDNHISEQLSVMADSETVEAFIGRAETVGSRIIELMSSRAHIDPKEANRVLNEATRRISKDIETGGLRFIRVREASVFDRLIKRCMEHISRMPPDKLPSPKSTSGLGSSSPDVKPVEVSLEAVVSTSPELGSTDRKVMALSNFFRLEPFAIAQILSIDRDESEKIAKYVNGLLESTARKKS